jgi:hypothetical protein
VVPFGVPVEVAFDYLADPANRPEWQSSLRRVADVEPGPPRVGQHWTDVTWPGLRPRMQTVGCDRPVYWAEWGQWRTLATAWLQLQFHPRPEGCVVTALFGVDLAPRVRRLGPVVSVAARPAVRADLARASRLLADRQ